MKEKKRRRLFAALALGLLILLFSPLFPFLRSLGVMGVYSRLHQRRGLAEEEGVALSIPGGLSTAEKDWYPFVITFVADERYARYVGEPEARLTILYNFPAFDYRRGCSLLYDEVSPYYNSFYGAYLLRDSSNEALAAGTLDEDGPGRVAAFDFFQLVLGDFGLEADQRVFDYTLVDRRENVPCAGSDGWTRLETAITVNGAAHNPRKGVRSYLQYGSPNFGEVGAEFAPVALSGLVYGRYFPDWDLGVYFYIMASEEVCASWEREILPHCVLEEKA